MSQEEFLLKWNDHHASFFTIVEDLCRTEQLCDVTLACGGQVFETHKLILSVCSPYFRTLLNSRPDKHPIVYLKDVNPKHLEQLLSYMYRGEINVLQEDLGPLIETARGLQIKGLADAGDNNSRKEPKTNQNGLPSHPQTLNQPKRSRTSTPTPAPKIARIETSRPAPLPTQVLSPPSQNSYIEDDDQPIVEVDPTENSQIKQEMWMMSGSGRDDEESNEFEIPPEQYEQDMQAEDEQYIQAGNEGLTGQQDKSESPRNSTENESLSRLSSILPSSISITPRVPSPGISPPTWETSSPGVSPPPSAYPLQIPLKCPTCSKEFHVPSLLERHMRTHTNERPYQCRLCGRSYSQSGNLNVHLKTIHGVLVEGQRARAEPEGIRPHKCYICNRMFTTSSNMYQHIRVVHNIAIETSKSPKPIGAQYPFSQGANVNIPPSLPILANATPSHSSSQLEHWAQVQLNELKNLSSEQTLPPAQQKTNAPTKHSMYSQNKMEPTIQDTLQQLSALAGGSGMKKDKTSIYMMDQNKPIAPNADEEGSTLKKIKKEKV